MDLTALLKPSLSEVAAFTKRNAQNMAIVGDLRAARDGCQTKEARAMIEALIVPMQKQLQKDAKEQRHLAQRQLKEKKLIEKNQRQQQRLQQKQEQQ